MSKCGGLSILAVRLLLFVLGIVKIAGVPLQIVGLTGVMLPLGLLPGRGAGQGYWSAAYAVPNTPAIAGQTSYMQAFTIDPGAPMGIAATDGLSVTWFAQR